MKKQIRLLGVTGIRASILAFALAGTAVAAGKGYASPAPNSGDCIPDGSGFDRPSGSGVGPAPNSGDCIPDGSGFDRESGSGRGPAPNSGAGIPDGSGF